MDLPDETTYITALLRHEMTEIRMGVSVILLTMLISSVQLALRHPEYPDDMRDVVTDWIEAAIARLAAIDPTIAALMAAGNDPQPGEKDTP